MIFNDMYSGQSTYGAIQPMRRDISHLVNLDKTQLVGFLISAFVAFFLLFSGQDSLTSVTLGFVLAVLTQLFDIQKRLSDTEERLMRANTLSKDLYHDEWLCGYIEKIVADYRRVKPVWYEIFRQRAENAIIECHDIIHGLSEGNMVVGGRSPYGFGVSGIKFAKFSLKAVSLSGGKFWNSVWGENYLRSNYEAIKRGVKITRIFMNTSEALNDLVEVIKKHQDMGIDVYIVPIEMAHKHLHEDFVIMDDRFVNLTEYGGTGNIRQWQQSVDLVKIEQCNSKFDTILRMARKPDSLMLQGLDTQLVVANTDTKQTFANHNGRDGELSSIEHKNTGNALIGN